MSDNRSKKSQRDNKRWIKPGSEVKHRDWPKRKMIVDDILRKTETVVDENGKEEQKTFTVGIEAHWFNEDGSYGRGRFLTMELIPWKEDPKKPKKDPESFPKEIPSEVPSDN